MRNSFEEALSSPPFGFSDSCRLLSKKFKEQPDFVLATLHDFCSFDKDPIVNEEDWACIRWILKNYLQNASISISEEELFSIIDNSSFLPSQLIEAIAKELKGIDVSSVIILYSVILLLS